MMHKSMNPTRVASTYLAAQKLNLSHWGIEGLLTGQPVTLYHGTTRSFKTFDINRSRTELVNKFYGPGIFLTPSKRVAAEYAHANRNIGFDESLIDDLESRNRKAGAFLRQLYVKGYDYWDELTRESFGLNPDDSYMDAVQEFAGGVDPNTLADVGKYIIGSKQDAPSQDDGFVNIFDTSTGLPSYVYDMLDEIGLDSSVYRPKVYTVQVRVQNPQVTASKADARRAKSKGYDCVVFHGADLVLGAPEVAVFSPHDVKITHVEVL